MNLRGAFFLLATSLIGVVGGIVGAVFDHADLAVITRGALIGGSTVNALYATVVVFALHRQRRQRSL